MSYSLYKLKYDYYKNWYISLSTIERSSVIGVWVLNNVAIFDGILKEIDADNK